jgi:hypothetical protein
MRDMDSFLLSICKDEDANPVTNSNDLLNQ